VTGVWNDDAVVAADGGDVFAAVEAVVDDAVALAAVFVVFAACEVFGDLQQVSLSVF